MITALVVATVVGAQLLARIVSRALAPEVSRATGLLVETVVVAAMFGIVVWRIVSSFIARRELAAVPSTAERPRQRHLRLVE